MAPEHSAVPIDLDPSWGILGKLHGGYLLATMIGAAMRQTDPALHPHPVAASAIFAAAPKPGPAEVLIHPLRVGKSVATYRLALAQDGQSCVEVLLTAGTLPPAGSEPRWTSEGAPPPRTAPLADCFTPPRPKKLDRLPGVMTHVDLRLDPASAPWIEGKPGGKADFRGWASMISAWDPLLAQFILADVPPPVIFDLGLFGWAPTLQLQVILRRQVTAGWQQIRQWALLVEGGLLDEDCFLWDNEGRLTVQARQLAAFREA